MLCGVVWGLWIGFGLVAAGTFIGESKNRSTLLEKHRANSSSRNVVCFQIRLQEEGRQAREDELELWGTSSVDPRWRILGRHSVPGRDVEMLTSPRLFSSFGSPSSHPTSQQQSSRHATSNSGISQSPPSSHYPNRSCWCTWESCWCRRRRTISPTISSSR